MRRLYLNDCAAGDLVEDVYVISGKQLSPTTTGKHYIKAFVSDRSCQITARMWNATREIFGAMPESGFLRIRGRIENYQNNLQCIIEQMWPAKEGSFDVADLLPQTSKNINQMCGRLHEMLGSVQNRHLSALLQTYVDDEKLMTDLCRAPAAMNFHHAFVGGLLEHTLNAMEVADAIVKFYPGLNRDLLIAGIFLHDIAKTWELCYDCAFSYSDGGQLVGHIVKSVMWVEHKAKEAEAILGEPVPQPLIDVLQHIILSHHGQTEFGAVKLPATPEALAVHAIENLDAKLMMALSATRGETQNAAEGNWTEYMKAFGARLYRPDVAPAEAIAADAASPEAPSAAPPHAPAGAQGADGPRETPHLRITNPLFESVPAGRK
jgi:3'-5' exoribonuclease